MRRSPSAWIPALPPIEGPRWREVTLLVLLLSTVFVCSLKVVDNPDSFWHLAVGREIWQTGHLVRTETFSFTARGAGWEDTEWLFHALIYPAWQVLGEKGVSVLVAALAVLAVASCYRCVRLLGGGALALSLWMAVFMAALQTRVAVRPDIVSLLCMMLLCEGLLRRRATDNASRGFWIFTSVLFWVWCQFHGAWAYGFALLCLDAAGRTLDARRAGRLDRKLLLALGAPVAAPALAVFLNPYGWRIPWFPVKHLLSFADPALPTIAEWQHTPWSWGTAPVLAALLLGFAAWWWPLRRLSFRDAAWCVSQSLLGLYWARYAAYAGLTLAPFGVRALDGFLSKPALRRAAWSVALLALIGVTFAEDHHKHRPGDMGFLYPVEETRFLLERGVSGKVLHDYEVGGFIEWVAPHRLFTFFDGRYFVFIPASKDYREATRTRDIYGAFLDKYAFDIAIRPYQPFKLKGAPGEPPRGPSAILFPPDRWALVTFGEYGMVFLRRQKAFDGLIAREEFKLLRPDDLDLLLWAVGEGKVDGAALALEIRRGLSGPSLPDDVARSMRAALARLETHREPAR